MRIKTLVEVGTEEEEEKRRMEITVGVGRRGGGCRGIGISREHYYHLKLRE